MTERYSDFFLEDADPNSLMNYIRRMKGNVQQQGLSVVDINIIDFLPPTITQIINNGGAGDVVGPSSATDGHVAIFDGITGKLIRDTGKIYFPKPALSDGEFSGDYEDGTAGAALAFGHLCYQSSSDSRWELADASAESSCSNRLGICLLAAAGDGSATRILTRGYVRSDGVFPSMSTGAPLFAGTTPGYIQSSPPFDYGGEIIRHIGYAVGEHELCFLPSGAWYEIGYTGS